MRKACHAPLISLETYERIRAIRAGGARIAPRADINRDFVLRGAVLCAECNVPLRSGWSTGKSKKYPYYLCQTRTCSAYGKSLGRDRVEGAFDAFLQRLAPSRSLFGVARAMLKHAWDARMENAKRDRAALGDQIDSLVRQSDKLLERILATDASPLIDRYEARLAALDLDKAVLQEKLDKCGRPARPFEEVLELSLRFLSNPWEIRQKAGFDLRRHTTRHRAG